MSTSSETLKRQQQQHCKWRHLL